VSDAVLATLADYGALGIMVLFLIWQHLGMQKRLDGLVDSFRQDSEAMNTSFDERVETIRAKYEVVIEGIRRECREAEDKVVVQRDKLQDELAGIIRDADRKLDTVLAKLDP
tara:strand:+ start:10473 stop:10808 length:336 start_codon:yes stop_codon:yes gene_type:complete